MNHVAKDVSHVLSARSSFERRLSHISIKLCVGDALAAAQWAAALPRLSHGDVGCERREASFFCGCFVFALFCVFARLVGIITQSQRRTTCQHNQVGGIELCQRQTQQTA